MASPCFVPSHGAAALFTKPTARRVTSRPRRHGHAVRRRRLTLCVQNDLETVPTSGTVRSGDELDGARLASFAAAVKGEWAGFEGEFDAATGAVRPIPNYYVPEDFATWGLEPKGFECNHSSIVRGTKYYLKFFRVLPTVALFADHVDLETTFTVTDLGAERGAHVFRNGSHSGGPTPVNTVRDSILDAWPAADLCIRHDAPGARRAVHARLRFDFANAALVDTVRVVRESFSCVYCDGADIEGSSGYVEGWPDNPKATPADLAGEWQLDDGTSISRPDGGPPETPSKCLYLPSGITVGVDRTSEGEVVAWLGWCVDDTHRYVLTRSYAPDGSVIESKLSRETRTS